MRIAGAGCCLIDSIYKNSSYEDEAFARVMSVAKGDGGLIEGGLVFSEDIEVFANRPYKEILDELSGARAPDAENLGGPAVVALVHASQILHSDGIEVSFYGAVGDDEQARHVRAAIARTPLKGELKTVLGKRTATTDVFDDPSQRKGKGERSFINTVGAAGQYGPDDIPDAFYEADIVLLGGTALVPRLHDGLLTVLRRAKQRGCITVVGTVYDFRNEKRAPDKPWPLGGEGSYAFMDLLVTDEEEALRLSGATEVLDAAKRLIGSGVSSLIITRGALDILVYSNGSVIRECDLTSLPVSKYMDDMMAKDPSLRKDTTGCGDNFAGGVLVALAKHQLKGGPSLVSMRDVCAYGASSGGLTCTYHGGTFYEKAPGEKAALLQPAVDAYLEMVEEV
ncbi:MAG: carbohydrate kinase family protein [Sphaerochaeta sp.]|nr:carbohydrate kinase family protein [Sphaerochaeta sp.]